MTGDGYRMNKGLRSVRALAVPLVVVAIVAAPAAPSEARSRAHPAIIDARVGAHDGTSRVVLQLSKRVDYRMFTLADPYRVVIDLEQVTWRLPARRLPVRDPLVGALRYGLFRPGTSRVVIDLVRPARVSEAFVIAPLAGGQGYRLVVDLVAADRSAFLGTVRGARAAAQPALPVRAVFALPPRKPRPPVRRHVVVIDPGHGGGDPGAISVSGVYEKHVTLSVARLLREVLRKNGRYKVLLTRNRDRFVGLRQRLAFARKVGAELLISIHADAHPREWVRGASVYTLSEKASDAEAAALADRENKAGLIDGVDLSDEEPEVANILIDLAQRETMNQSARFASLVADELQQQTRMLHNTHRFAGFAVLKAPDVPSVLVELGYLSNRDDERMLTQKRDLNKLAAAIARAVDAYFAGIREARRGSW